MATGLWHKKIKDDDRRRVVVLSVAFVAVVVGDASGCCRRWLVQSECVTDQPTAAGVLKFRSASDGLMAAVVTVMVKKMSKPKRRTGVLQGDFYSGDIVQSLCFH